MKAAQFASEAAYWNMKTWLLGEAVVLPPNVTNSQAIRGPHGQQIYLRTSHLEEVHTHIHFFFLAIITALSMVSVSCVILAVQNYMVKWFAGRWLPSRGVRALPSDLERAKRATDSFDYVLFTDRLATDLPLLASLVGYRHPPNEVSEICANWALTSVKSWYWMP
jgi:hypothetical protein